MTDHITPRRGRLYKAFAPEEAEIGNWSARCNVVNQETLLHALREQAEQPVEVIADRLDIAVDEVMAALSGKIDLTMTEIRLLGIASDLVISYQVQSARRDYRGWLSGLKLWRDSDEQISLEKRPHPKHAELNPSDFGRRMLEEAH